LISLFETQLRRDVTGDVEMLPQGKDIAQVFAWPESVFLRRALEGLA